MDSARLSLAFIDSLGGGEMVMIFLVVLLLFGGEKLPGFARGMGKAIREFKKAAAGVEEEFKRALEEDERKTTATTYIPPPPTPLPAAPDPLTITEGDPHHPADSYHETDPHGGPDPYHDAGPSTHHETPPETPPIPATPPPVPPTPPATVSDPTPPPAPTHLTHETGPAPLDKPPEKI